MTINGWVQIVLYCVLLTLLVRPFGGYMTQVFTSKPTILSPALGPVERGIYRLCGVDEREEQHWVTYAVTMLLFSVAGFVTLYGLQRLQAMLPFNPQHLDAIGPDLAFNTSVSFVTNTNWQWRWCTSRRTARWPQTPLCYPMTGWRRTESGRPAANIRFSTATPMAASVCWAAKPRARSRGPISAL